MTQYPHAKNYITPEGMKTASKETLEGWEYEATLCDRVITVFGGDKCPNCGCRIFSSGDAVIDFNFPFVHGSRIRIVGFRTSENVVCSLCGLTKEVKNK